MYEPGKAFPCAAFTCVPNPVCFIGTHTCTVGYSIELSFSAKYLRRLCGMVKYKLVKKFQNVQECDAT